MRGRPTVQSVWPGIILFTSGLGGASVQVVAMVTDEATAARWVVLVLMLLMAVSGLGVFLSARRQAGTRP